MSSENDPALECLLPYKMCVFYTVNFQIQKEWNTGEMTNLLTMTQN